MNKIHMEKSVGIVKDLMEYCIVQGANSLDTSLRYENGCAILTVTAHIPGMKPSRLEALYEELSLHRQREVEQNYWELSSEPEATCEMSLIGMMTDKAQLDYENDILKIKLWRAK